MWTLVTVGFLSIAGQVVLLRELSVASYGIELVYVLALGVWLLAGAIGALAGRWPRRLLDGATASLFGLCGIALPAGVVVARAARPVLGAVPGAYLTFPQQAFVIVCALAPASVLLGVLFQWGARRYISEGGTLAIAYGIESAGGLAAGIAATMLFKLGAQSFAVAVGCGCVAAVAPLVPPAWRGAGRARVALAIAVVAGGALMWPARRLDRRMTAWTHPSLVDTRDTPYGRVTVTQLEGQLSVFDNDALWFDTEDASAETFAHLVLLQHPNPQRVLLLGGGMEGVASSALQHGPRAVDDVELDERMYRMIERDQPGDARAVHAPGVRVLFTDPRRFAGRAGGYDAVLVSMPEPASASANRFYTREFFEACARVLNPGGVLGFRLPSSENFWTPLLARRTVSIYRAAAAAFPSIVVLPGTTDVFLASREPLPADPALLAARLARRHIQARLVSSQYLRYLYTNDRRAAIARALESGRAPANTDVQPICFEYAAVMWLSRFFPGLGAIGTVNGAAYPWTAFATRMARTPHVEWVAGIAVLAVFLLCRLRSGWTDTVLVGVAGFAGMMLEAILVLHFQMKNGVVFQDIGVLLTGFMAGLAAGAIVCARLTRPGDRETALSRWPGAAILAGIAIVAMFVDLATERGAAGGLVPILLLLAFAGALVAALFAYVSQRAPVAQARLVSPLYAADLLGGCAASLLGSLALIPIAGLAASAKWVGVLALLSLALL